MPDTPNPDRGPLTHDFDLLDLTSVAAVELHVGENGQVWFNVNNKCLFRAASATRIEIIDDREGRKRKIKR